MFFTILFFLKSFFSGFGLVSSSAIYSLIWSIWYSLNDFWWGDSPRLILSIAFCSSGSKSEFKTAFLIFSSCAFFFSFYFESSFFGIDLPIFSLNYLSASLILTDSIASSAFLKFSFLGFSAAIYSTFSISALFSALSSSFAASSNGSPKSSCLAFKAFSFSSYSFYFFNFSWLIFSYFFFSSSLLTLFFSSTIAYYFANSSCSVKDIFSKS